MGQKQISPVVIVAAIVLVVAGIGYFGFRAVQPPAPAAGSYTPGVPPWLDKNSPSYGKGPNFQAARRH